MTQKALLFQIDGFTSAQTVMQNDHTYIHEGKAFTIIYNYTSLASAAQTYLGFTTPNAASGIFVHFRPLGVSTTASGIIANLYENLSYSSGSAYTPFNRNRLSTKTATVTAATGVTSTPGSELIIAGASAGAAGNPVSSTGGAAPGSAEEIVLKQNTPYVIEVDNIGASTTSGFVTLFWYEEGRGL